MQQSALVVQHVYCCGSQQPPAATAADNNHSCEPNCAIFKWQSAAGLPVVGIRVGDAAIAAKVELTFDYQLDIAVGAAQRCLCGAATCRGLVLDALDAAREESDLRAVDARLSAAAHREVPEGWGVRI